MLGNIVVSQTANLLAKLKFCASAEVMLTDNYGLLNTR